MVIFSGLVLLIFFFDVCYKNKIVKMLETGQTGIIVNDQELNTESPRLESFDSNGNIIELPDLFLESQDEIADKLKKHEIEPQIVSI